MKRTLAALVAITFLGSSLSLPAFAAVKAGARPLPVLNLERSCFGIRVL